MSTNPNIPPDAIAAHAAMLITLGSAAVHYLPIIYGVPPTVYYLILIYRMLFPKKAKRRRRH